MSLQKYVRQLRPRTENYIPHVDKIQSLLSEAAAQQGFVYEKNAAAALKKFGVDSPAELEGDKKKKFFNYVDKNWKADHEEVDVHKSYKVDGRRKNFREKMRKLGYTKSRF